MFYQRPTHNHRHGNHYPIARSDNSVSKRDARRGGQCRERGRAGSGAVPRRQTEKMHKEMEAGPEQREGKAGATGAEQWAGK